MVAFCFSFGAVLKVPTSLRLPRLPTKRNQYFVFGRSCLTRFWTVLSWLLCATTECSARSLNLRLRATSSVYLPLFAALPHSTALVEVTSPAVTPNWNPLAASAGGASSRVATRASRRARA